MQQLTAARPGPAETTTGQAATSKPIPTPHTAWCQPQHCLAFPDAESTHRHLIGKVSDVEVWVERDDYARPDGVQSPGVPRVHVFGPGVIGLTRGDTDLLARLLGMASMFAADAAEVS